MEATNYNSGVSCLREHSCFVSGLSLWRVMPSGRNAWGYSPQQVLLVVRAPTDIPQPMSWLDLPLRFLL